ncbi:hypothetical protein [Streptomyces sp. KL116D]|uniref:hypothetical protein n=1 Tax=Streptomyces sp. KL116D TaxID=3045152 RepID=UPI0035591697
MTTRTSRDASRVLKECGIAVLTTDGDRITAEPPPPEMDLAALNAALVTVGVRVRGFGVERASLEDAFVAPDGRGIRCRRPKRSPRPG